MLLTIHQPEFLPWPGFIDKIIHADHFIVLDTVKYQKNYFINRCRIKQGGAPRWLTIPVRKNGSEEQICEKKIEANGVWGKKNLQTLRQNYEKAPFWSDHEALFLRLFDAQNWSNLVDINLAGLEYICRYLSLPFNYTRTSTMDLQSSGSGLILDICRKMEADTYLSGTFGREYLNLQEFKDAGISVIFQDYAPPVYEQINGPYCGPLSVIDMLLNHGPESLRIIESGRRP